jgi:hypothetical protein
MTKDYPQEFLDWVSRKMSVEALAMLAATCYRCDEAAPFDATLLLDRAFQTLFEAWSLVKRKQDSLAKPGAKD